MNFARKQGQRSKEHSPKERQSDGESLYTKRRREAKAIDGMHWQQAQEAWRKPIRWLWP